MLNHLFNIPRAPHRVVVLGAKGFVGSTFTKRLKNQKINYLALGRQELDLQDDDAATKLATILNLEDVLVVISAKAPCKNYYMLFENIQMMKNVCDALKQKKVQQVIYISSDAVYADSMNKLDEKSPAAPSSLHGVMHLAREQMLQSVVARESLLILRPSLLYGLNDPHNGYGPNSFYRLAKAKQTIELFGKGEEQRDHVYIEDVAEIISMCILYQSYGTLNITSGEVTSFYNVAQMILSLMNVPNEIKSRPRNGPMPHNGYRAFDNQVCQNAFKDFKYTSLIQGLNFMMEQDLINERA